jgi:hypothetical protein
MTQEENTGFLKKRSKKLLHISIHTTNQTPAAVGWLSSPPCTTMNVSKLRQPPS